MEDSLLPQGDHEKTFNDLIQTLPKRKAWTTEYDFLYKGVWLVKPTLRGALALQSHFKARPTDVFLVAFPKCGTTWLRALMFATINRYRFDSTNNPLLTTGPHDLFPFLDLSEDLCPGFESLPSPRLFATHFSYKLLPESVVSCVGKIVYVWCDAKDTLISYWHFYNQIKEQELPKLSLEEIFERFCEGSTYYGLFWDHVLGYWKASLESPDKILCLRYEDMKREPSIVLKRLAEFVGLPFSFEEERGGVVQDILKLCSFENLRNLEVNKTGMKKMMNEIKTSNSRFFRKGEIGDYKNYLTNEMTERMDMITAQKFQGTGLISY